MKKFFNILTGWGKAIGILQVSKAEYKLSELRLSICDSCEFAEGSKFLKIINDEAEEVYSLKCTKCKCPCLEKSLVVDEQCPENKW
jgi:hypothetical protein